MGGRLGGGGAIVRSCDANDFAEYKAMRMV